MTPMTTASKKTTHARGNDNRNLLRKGFPLSSHLRPRCQDWAFGLANRSMSPMMIATKLSLRVRARRDSSRIRRSTFHGGISHEA
jgi:hypothetical protein